MVSDILTRETREWNLERINHLLPELASIIQTIKPSLLDVQDSYVWPLQNSGKYSVKTGYFSLVQHEVLAPATPDWKKLVWNPPLLPKLKYFLWKILQNALPTGENLRRRGMLTNTFCQSCGDAESLNHIFFHCSLAKEVWAQELWTTPLSLDSEAPFATTLQQSYSWKNLSPMGIKGNIFPWIFWNLWVARNKRLFHNLRLSAQEVLSQAIRSAREWEQAQPLAPAAKAPQPHININHNRPLTVPTIFCNTDASWKAQSAGLAWIFSTQSEAELGRKALSLNFVSSPCMAEALAIRGALLHAASLNYTNICLRTDSQVLFGAINKRIWTIELFGILSDIDSLVFSSSSPFASCRIVFIPRSANGLADGLAKAHLPLSAL